MPPPRKQQPYLANPGDCKYCGRKLDKRRKYEPRFCPGGICASHYETNRKAMGLSKRTPNKDTPVERAAKKLAFNELYDPIRDTVREEIRATISQHVKDNVLGMTEMLSDLLPHVLAGLATDIQSEDVFIRQKAQALILKYVMPLSKEEVVSDDSKVLNVIHRVAVPDTALGYAVEGELVALPPGVEAFEKDWPECVVCGERKNPATGAPDGNGEFLCHACKYRAEIRRGERSSTEDNDATVEYMGQ